MFRKLRRELLIQNFNLDIIQRKIGSIFSQKRFEGHFLTEMSLTAFFSAMIPELG